jgi:hypothetical protein
MQNSSPTQASKPTCPMNPISMDEKLNIMLWQMSTEKIADTDGKGAEEV